MTPDAPELTELRKRFEEWATKERLFNSFVMAKNRNYKDHDCQLAWEAFQAGAKSSPAEPVPSEVLEAAKHWRTSDEPVSGLWAAIIADWALEHTQLKGESDGQ